MKVVDLLIFIHEEPARSLFFKWGWKSSVCGILSSPVWFNYVTWLFLWWHTVNDSINLSVWHGLCQRTTSWRSSFFKNIQNSIRPDLLSQNCLNSVFLSCLCTHLPPSPFLMSLPHRLGLASVHFCSLSWPSSSICLVSVTLIYTRTNGERPFHVLVRLS